LDLELLEHRQHLASLSPRILSPQEQHAGGPLGPKGASTLLHTWVRKEACMKALGLGLTHEMSELTLTSSANATGGTATTPAVRGTIGWLDLTLPDDCPGVGSLAWISPA